MPILFLTFHFHEKKNDSTFRIVIVNLLTMKIKLTEILEFNNSNVRQDDGEKSGGLQVRGHLQEHTDWQQRLRTAQLLFASSEGGWHGVLLQQLLAGYAMRPLSLATSMRPLCFFDNFLLYFII